MEFSGELSPEGRENIPTEKKIKTTCSYCGVGCQLELVIDNEKIVDVEPVKVVPNNGLLCVKGKFGHKYINHPERLHAPLIKKGGQFVETSWDEAYSLIAEKIGKLKQLHVSTKTKE